MCGLGSGGWGVGRLLRMWRERERAEQATLPLIKMKPRWVICVIVDSKPPQTTSFSPTLPPQMTSLSPISSPLRPLLLRASYQPSSTDDFEESLCRKSTLLTSGQKQMNNWHPSLPPTSHPFLDCLITQLHVSYFGDLAFVPVLLKCLIEKKDSREICHVPKMEICENTAGKNYHPFPEWKLWKDTKRISTISLPKQTGILPGTQCSGAAQFQKLGHLQRKEFEKMLRKS